MNKVIEKLKEIESGVIGITIYSSEKQTIVTAFNSDISVPLASAAKVAIGFCIAKWVEDKTYDWDTIIDNIRFDPKEDSKELYPHFQDRETLPLRDAVEVMIACHDSFVANSIVEFCGGWDQLNEKIKSYFQNINITQDPLEIANNGELAQVFELMLLIYQGYKANPGLWTPVINGLVRQRYNIEGIPSHLLNHMTGGLKSVVVDLGILGDFNKNSILYVLGAKDLPNRRNNQVADDIITEAIKLLYDEYLNQ